MKSLKQAARGSARALLMGLVAAAALSGCGGGSEPIEPFAPTRLVAFGDETSVLTADGRKYSVNAINSVTNALDCASNPLWIQALANRYGMVFPQCNPLNLAAPQGRIMATVGAKVDDVRAQLDRYLASDVLTEHTLVTLFAGTNDILGLYAQYPAQSEADLMAAAGDTGRQLGELAVRMMRTGGRTLVVSLPDVGATPFAFQERNNRPPVREGLNRAQFLTALTTAFNTELYRALGALNDGRLGALVLGDDMSTSLTKYPGQYGLSDIMTPACQAAVSLPNCSTSTLIGGASVSTYLWADDRHFGPAGHSTLGNLALSRVVRNPL